MKYIGAVAFGAAFIGSSPVLSASNEVSITLKGDQRCIISNGIPDHETGRFPNKGNPHSIRGQSIEFCVTAKPRLGTGASKVATVGIALNGIIIRPGTADWYDASSPRRHSRNPSSGWNLEGLGARETLGMDTQNAHVDNRGIYHYHGMPPALSDIKSASLIGYAADGFEIHYIGSEARASYRLKKGQRPTAPGGGYDGTYNQDWEFSADVGNLDQCNGGRLNRQYVYFATDRYPFFPRCLMGSDITYLRGDKRANKKK